MEVINFMIKKLCSIFAAVMLAIPSGTCYAEEIAGISAKSYVLMEKNTGKIIYEKNSDTKLPMASTTKIMTTLLCLESGDLDTEFTVDPEAIKTEGSSMGLTEGDIVSKRDLCIGMLLPSGNDAANAAAVRIGGSIENFAKLMNSRAAEIGMTRTYFVTPSGLEAEGHGASSRDMALLAREALRNEDFTEICSKSTMELSFGNPPYRRWLKNTNKLLKQCDGVYGVKTGFTDEAGRCLVSACEREGISLICVTLNDPNDYHDHALLYDTGFKQLEKYTIPPETYTVDVVGGEKETVNLQPLGSVSMGIVKGEIPDTEVKLSIKHFMYAPVEKGTYAGKAEYYTDGKLIGTTELYTAEQCMIKMPPKDKNIIDKILELLK